jgi:uncharacterized protein (DUF697 family)
VSRRTAKLGPLSVVSVLRELRRGGGDPRPLAVAGARELVPILARELRAGGDAAAVVEGWTDGAAALVWVGPPNEDDLSAADRAGVPIVAVGEQPTMPYVLATDIVLVRPGEGFPVERIVAALARRLGEDGTALAARLPLLRPAVCRELIALFARRNGLIAAAVFVPGVDMPLLTLNQMRLVLRVALAYGRPLDRRRAAELLGVVGVGYGLRTVAREALSAVPVAGWAVKATIAYSGTRAVGEAAVRHFEARASQNSAAPSGPGPTL